jgi:hypothetical protein
MSNDNATKLRRLADEEPVRVLAVLDEFRVSAERCRKIEAMTDEQVGEMLDALAGNVDMSSAEHDVFRAAAMRLKRARGGSFRECSWCDAEGKHKRGPQWACDQHEASR